jgi:polyketide biosynthesis 3-hydroxy-3-methylglutaryl-CoA synthase-like enzyme PksG
MAVGIEAIYAYGGQAAFDVRALFEARKLNLDRFENLAMKKKAVGLPCEDPVTHAVNAAKPIVARLSPEEKKRIELVISASESGIDFGKSIATYAHDYLELGRGCRIFEVKQACYAGTAALQTAVHFVASGASPGAKALVIATDVAAQQPEEENYAEPSMGTGAVAMLVSDTPSVFEIDLGASGYCSYEVMDTCRPIVGHEIGDADLSLMSYIDCLGGAFKSYAERVEGADYVSTFDYLAFHTPFAGLVRGAHRKMMRQMKRASPDEIEEDFARRIGPSLRYCVEVGNVYSATLWLALCGVIAHAKAGKRHRVGMFSYGSGCSSEFFSGVVGPDAAARLSALGLEEALGRRYELTFAEYERLVALNSEWGFGVRDKQVDAAAFREIYERQFEGRGLLTLRGVSGYHRKYAFS